MIDLNLSTLSCELPPSCLREHNVGSADRPALTRLTHCPAPAHCHGERRVGPGQVRAVSPVSSERRELKIHISLYGHKADHIKSMAFKALSGSI